MNVYQLMTRDVIAIRPDTPIHTAARLMVDHGISGLPVVDDEGRLVGIISEGDLILRQKPREPASWWRTFFDDGERLARDYQKAVGTTVGEVMSHPVITASPALPLEGAAAIMDDCHVRRLPVVFDGALVGIVTRGDLIKALATAPRPRQKTSDVELQALMKARMADESWAASCHVMIDAQDGVIVLIGVVDGEAKKAALETMARSIEGCRSVDNQLVTRSALTPCYGI